MNKPIVNVLSIDLEDYYMVSAFETVVKREDWSKYESRIERNTYRILEILSAAEPPSQERPNRPDRPNRLDGPDRPDRPKRPDRPLTTGIRATFFCLGWIAEKYPALIKEIDRQGHEVSSHGYDHRLIYDMSPEEFREDARRSKNVLEGITGKEVIGYRAPSCSITAKSLWAFRILAEEGYRYDSSIFPIHHDRYGIPAAPRFPFVINLVDGEVPDLGRSSDLKYFTAYKPSETFEKGHRIIEFPLSTVKFFGFNAPVSGGGYMRLLPYALIRRGLERINDSEKHAFVIYIHPWELDPGQPRFENLSVLSKFRHYINLDSKAGKLRRLLSDFTLSSMKNVIGFE